MKPKVFCFASAKGGSGKTIISASLAKVLAGLGKKVLLIDMDAATNGLTLLYLEELVEARSKMAKENESFYGIFEATEVELPTPFRIEENIEIIPAVYEMKQTENVSEESLRRSISKTLSTFRDKYNYIILDAQAGADTYSQIAIENADEIVIVSEYNPISAEGVERLKRLFPNDFTYENTWILFNKILPEFAKSLGEFLSVARYLNPIPWDAKVVLAFASRKLAINMESGSDYTLSLIQTAYSLLGTEIEEEINSWKKDKESEIQKPNFDRLHEIEKEISTIEDAKFETEYKLKHLKNREKRIKENVILMLGLIAIMTVTSQFFAFPSEFILMTSLLIILSLILLLALYHNLFKRNSLEKEKILNGQILSLVYNLEELKERRKYYRTIVDSDLETLLKIKGIS